MTKCSKCIQEETMAEKIAETEALTKAEEVKSSPKKSAKKLVAKKAFKIKFPGNEPYYRDIEIGDDVSDVPEKFKVNLKTEGVI